MAMKRLWLALFLCLVILTMPTGNGLLTASYAQGGRVLTNLEISLWPEYDRPSVLVIYRGQFDPAASYPLPVEIGIPADAGSPHAVAYIGEDGGRFNLEYTTQVEGDQLIIAFQLPTPNFQLEYYDALPVSDDGVRGYTFTYTAEYSIDNLLLEIQEPPLAVDFVLDPAADSSSAAGDGLRYHVLNAGSVAQGDSVSWSFRYDKDDDRLTSEFFQQAQPPPASQQPATAPESNSPVALFVVAFVALIGVGVAAYWLGQRTQAPAPGRASAHGKASAPKKRPVPAEPARRKRDREAYFCHKCGAEIRDDAHFCNICGAAVRRE